MLQQIKKRTRFRNVDFFAVVFRLRITHGPRLQKRFHRVAIAPDLERHVDKIARQHSADVLFLRIPNFDHVHQSVICPDAHQYRRSDGFLDLFAEHRIAIFVVHRNRQTRDHQAPRNLPVIVLPQRERIRDNEHSRLPVHRHAFLILLANFDTISGDHS